MNKVYFAHNSCFNSSFDLNLIKEGFKRRGFEIVDNPVEADEVFFSGCAAHETWVNDAIDQINKISSLDKKKKITVTGCVVGIDADKVKTGVKDGNLSFQTHEQILSEYTNFELQDLDKEFSQDETMNFEGENEFNDLRQRIGKEKLKVIFELDKVDREFETDLVGKYKSMTKGFLFYNEAQPTEFITVSRSCLYKCSFCAIPKGRGDYTSVPLEDILRKAKVALAKGTRRITLIGDEVGNYGADLKTHKIADLVKGLLALDKDLKIGIRYIEPTPLLRNFEMFKKFCDEGRIYLLYAPLQTGSQTVLRDMNRRYDLNLVVEKYKELIETGTTLFCNWMVGFPTETESDFQETLNLAKQIDFQISTAIPYSERPGTKSPLLPVKVDDDVKTERLNSLRKVLADLKVERFRKRLQFLPSQRRGEILETIKIAESVFKT